MQGSRFGSPIIIQRYASPSRAVVVPSVGRLAVSFCAFVRKPFYLAAVARVLVRYYASHLAW